MLIHSEQPHRSSNTPKNQPTPQNLLPEYLHRQYANDNSDTIDDSHDIRVRYHEGRWRWGLVPRIDLITVRRVKQSLIWVLVRLELLLDILWRTLLVWYRPTSHHPYPVTLGLNIPQIPHRSSLHPQLSPNLLQRPRRILRNLLRHVLLRHLPLLHVLLRHMPLLLDRHRHPFLTERTFET